MDQMCHFCTNPLRSSATADTARVTIRSVIAVDCL